LTERGGYEKERTRKERDGKGLGMKDTGEGREGKGGG